MLKLKDDHVIAASHDFVQVVENHLGKAVLAGRCFPAGSVIGEITGRVFEDTSESDDYTFEYEDRLLDPVEPFRFLNHRCDPNCEFEMLDIPRSNDGPATRGLYLVAVADILEGQELTIDYNWPATYAIVCLCRSEKCRGWIVAEEELDSVA